jgi:1-acyl-sn-glycerol-3-phosphate acyltransferase
MRTMVTEYSPPFVDGAYRSAAAGGARCCPELRFYARAAPIVWRAGRAARRGRYGDAEWRASSMAIVRALEAAGVRFEIAGVERFARLPGPCVFVGNHMSTLETFVLPSVIMSAKRVTFVVKRELVAYPVFGHVMRSRDPVLVGRANPREDLAAVFDGGAERLAAGISIVVFPQTTRTPVFDPASFNSIGVKLARRAGVPVVPIALKTDAWGNGRIVKDIGWIDPAKTVHIEFGEPLAVTGTGAGEHQRIVEFIRGRLLGWGGCVAPAP